MLDALWTAARPFRTWLAGLLGYSCELTPATNAAGYFDLTVSSPEETYVVRFPATLRPRDVVRIVEQSTGNEVTPAILRFAGPGWGFYGVPLTPRVLGFGALTVTFRGGAARTFEPYEPLVLLSRRSEPVVRAPEGDRRGR